MSNIVGLMPINIGNNNGQKKYANSVKYAGNKSEQRFMVTSLINQIEIKIS